MRVLFGVRLHQCAKYGARLFRMGIIPKKTSSCKNYYEL